MISKNCIQNLLLKADRQNPSSFKNGIFRLKEYKFHYFETAKTDETDEISFSSFSSKVMIVIDQLEFFGADGNDFPFGNPQYVISNPRILELLNEFKKKIKEKEMENEKKSFLSEISFSHTLEPEELICLNVECSQTTQTFSMNANVNNSNDRNLNENNSKLHFKREMITDGQEKEEKENYFPSLSGNSHSCFPQINDCKISMDQQENLNRISLGTRVQEEDLLTLSSDNQNQDQRCNNSQSNSNSKRNRKKEIISRGTLEGFKRENINNQSGNGNGNKSGNFGDNGNCENNGNNAAVIDSIDFMNEQAGVDINYLLWK